MKKIFIKPGREKLPKSRNPLVFSGAILKTENPEKGEIVEVVDFKGDFIAYGHWNDKARVAARLLEWDKSIIPDTKWFKTKTEEAFRKRSHLLSNNITNAFRVIFREHDMLPGIEADFFGEGVLLNVISPGMDKEKQSIAETLMNVIPSIKWVYDRSDSPERKEEGLENSVVLLAGEGFKNEQEIIENGYKFKANCDIQKNGFYSEYRSIRDKIKKYSKERTVLDACCFCGEFSVYALGGEASRVTLCDVSKFVLDRAKKNITYNGFEENMIEIVRDDIFNFLRKARQNRQTFSLIILDPSPFVESRTEASKWIKTYKDLNMAAMSILEKDGILATFCRDDSITPEMFREALAFASKDSFSDMTIEEQFHQSSDYPIRISAPETEFLKGMLLRKS